MVEGAADKGRFRFVRSCYRTGLPLLAMGMVAGLLADFRLTLVCYLAAVVLRMWYVRSWPKPQGDHPAVGAFEITVWVLVGWTAVFIAARVLFLALLSAAAAGLLCWLWGAVWRNRPWAWSVMHRVFQGLALCLLVAVIPLLYRFSLDAWPYIEAFAGSDPIMKIGAVLFLVFAWIGLLGGVRRYSTAFAPQNRIVFPDSFDPW